MNMASILNRYLAQLYREFTFDAAGIAGGCLFI